jgi:hypothetical protein
MTDVTDFPPGDEALMATDEEPVVDEKAARAFRRQLDRAAGMSVADAAKLHLRAEGKRLAAEHLEAQGDRIGARLEAAEATDSATVADLALDPLSHSTGRVVVGAGGEAALGSKSQFTDTVRERPDMIAVTASEQRMELADAAGALELALDVAQTIGAHNSLERMLAGELAAAHRLAMTMMGQAVRLTERFENSGHVALSVEASRMANAASKMMLAFQGGMATIARLRSGGQQVVTVQHVNVSGGQAVVAGQVKARAKRRKGEG